MNRSGILRRKRAPSTLPTSAQKKGQERTEEEGRRLQPREGALTHAPEANSDGFLILDF